MNLDDAFHVVGKHLPEKTVNAITGSKAAALYRKWHNDYYSYKRAKAREKEPKAEERESNVPPSLPFKIYVDSSGLIYSEQEKPESGVSELDLANLSPWVVSDWLIIHSGGAEIVGISKDEDPFVTIESKSKHEATRIWKASNILITESRDSNNPKNNSWSVTDKSQLAEESKKAEAAGAELGWDPESGRFF